MSDPPVLFVNKKYCENCKRETPFTIGSPVVLITTKDGLKKVSIDPTKEICLECLCTLSK